MYIDTVPNRHSPPAVLLRESYRDENGKVKKRTIANLSKCTPEVIEGLRALLKGAQVSNQSLEESFEIERSLHHGHVAAALGYFKQIGLHNTLERKQSRQRALAIALIVGRLIEPCSKLALARHLSPETATNTLGQELDLGEVDEDDLYAAMRWLFDRQNKIESRLAKAHLPEGTAVLYDLTSTWYEGSHCSLAEHGHNRDGKKGKLQINIGLLCNADGCPISVQVYPGSTGDPATVASQLRALRQRFNLKRVIIVGDRGMLTTARIEQIRHAATSSSDDGTTNRKKAQPKSANKENDLKTQAKGAKNPEPPLDLDLEGYGWISALRGDQVRKLADAGAFQPELFDQRWLAEITCEELYPGERLVVCRNPILAEERARKRQELLAITEEKLRGIQEATQRTKAPYPGKRGGAGVIGRRIERECAKYKMLKHFVLDIQEKSFTFTRKESSLEQESALDGFYIVRAGRVSEEEMDAEKLVETYKSLSHVERNFRAMKTTAIDVRPIFHREEDMVRAHIFICMLACHLRWQMESKLKPALFNDEEHGGAQRESSVAKAQRSERAQKKLASRQAEDGKPIHSFATLLEDLSTLSRHTIRPMIKGAVPLYKLTKPTPVQAKALKLLGAKLQSVPACSQ